MLRVPDTNEFHPMEGYQGPVIVRALYNTTLDKAWVAGDADRAARQPWWGVYQYMSKTADPAACAWALLAALGGRRPNVTILDLEEGDGDQQARQHAWLTVMAGDPAADWTYSGDYYARSHGLTVQWLAAYQAREPVTAHELWQNTDAFQFPGMSSPCDGSVFNGSLADLIALTGGHMPLDDNDKAFITQTVIDQVRKAIEDQGAKGSADPRFNGVNTVLDAIAKLPTAAGSPVHGDVQATIHFP